jgi:hypothetical protein
LIEPVEESTGTTTSWGLSSGKSSARGKKSAQATTKSKTPEWDILTPTTFLKNAPARPSAANGNANAVLSGASNVVLGATKPAESSFPDAVPGPVSGIALPANDRQEPYVPAFALLHAPAEELCDRVAAETHQCTGACLCSSLPGYYERLKYVPVSYNMSNRMADSSGIIFGTPVFRNSETDTGTVAGTMEKERESSEEEVPLEQIFREIFSDDDGEEGEGNGSDQDGIFDGNGD